MHTRSPRRFRSAARRATAVTIAAAAVAALGSGGATEAGTATETDVMAWLDDVSGAMKIETRDMEPVATAMAVVLTYWLSYEYVRDPRRALEPESAAAASGGHGARRLVRGPRRPTARHRPHP